MKRRMFKLALFLHLGTIVNISVAWSIAWWGDPPTSFAPRDPVTEVDRDWWLAHRPSEAVGEPTARITSQKIGMTEVQMRNIEKDETGSSANSNGIIFQSFQRRIGLPLPTFEYSYWTRADQRPVQVDKSIWKLTIPGTRQSVIHYHEQAVLAFEFKIPNCRSCARGIPYRVQPLGFVVNTLTYALLCYLVIGVVGGWMRSNVKKARRYIGKCPTCGYNLLGKFEQGCPECGWRRGN